MFTTSKIVLLVDNRNWYDPKTEGRSYIYQTIGCVVKNKIKLSVFFWVIYMNIYYEFLFIYKYVITHTHTQYVHISSSSIFYKVIFSRWFFCSRTRISGLDWSNSNHSRTNVSSMDEKRIPRELGNCRATSELLKRFHRQFQSKEERVIS